MSTSNDSAIPQLSRPLVIGSRGSKLALAQARFTQDALRRLAPEVETRVEIIKTSADRDQITSLRTPSENGGSGVFVKELEQALLRGEIDLAVHSMKDVPTAIAEGLCIAAVPEREIARDVLLISEAVLPGGRAASLAELPAGARVGSGSFRRQAQLLALRPDLQILDIRGNVDTRIRKMEQGLYDAVALAYAGLRRLGLQHLISYEFPFAEMLPAPGQGALAIETRADDAFTVSVAAQMNHPDTALAVATERNFLERMGGGCNVPIATYARIDQGALVMDVLVASPDGRRMVRNAAVGEPECNQELVAALTGTMLAAGCREILHEFRN
ncbi:MAG: hydroxymethylbilane synthase [Acidobacteriota bacterium]|jgi:hydroxymethylbilane synthase|nr:hydroxymethylbilane synthase [Acidobacteriota bacterium]